MEAITEVIARRRAVDRRAWTGEAGHASGRKVIWRRVLGV